MQKLLKIIFIPFYAQCPEHRYSASARIRAEWPAKHIPADIVDEKMIGRDLSEYEFVVFQKCFSRKFIELARGIKENNPKTKIGLDLCDPVWDMRIEEVEEMISISDFIVVPTRTMAKEIYRIFDRTAYVIPDGHDLEYYKADQRKFKDKEESSIKYVWYGNSGTIKSLEAIMGYIEDVSTKHDSLTIIADPLAENMIKSDKINIIFKKWELDKVNEQIAECDIALNPKLNTLEYALKSNNKTVTSYILSVPCIEEKTNNEKSWKDQLIMLKDYTNRKRYVKIKRDRYIKRYRAEEIAKQWISLLNDLS